MQDGPAKTPPQRRRPLQRDCAGTRSSLVEPLVDLIGQLQHVRTAAGMKPAAYILENVAMQFNYGTQQQQGAETFAKLKNLLGEPVTFDAATVGSRTHRLRNWWTNLIHPAAANAVLAAIVREPGTEVNQVPQRRAGTHRRLVSLPGLPSTLPTAQPKRGKPCRH